MWILYAFLSAFFAGITAILSKIGIRNTNSHLATALRTIVVLVFAWAMVFLVNAQSGLGNIDTKSLVFLLLSGITTGGSWICYFKALQLGDVNKVAPIDKSSTILTVLLAFILLGEAVSWLKIFSLVLIGAGTYLMIELKQTGNSSPKSKSWFVYAILSAVFASATAILSKIGIENVQSYLGTAIRTVVVLIMAWLIVFITGKQKEIGKIDKKSWLFLFLSGLATGASWLFYYTALQEGDAAIVVPIDKLSILVTIVFSRIWLKEKLCVKSGVGLILLTLGTLLMLL